MPSLQALKSLVNTRINKHLSAADAEEIFEIVGKIITEYEDQAFCSKQEIDRQRRLLDMVLKPHIKLHRSDSFHLSVLKQEVSTEQQEWSSSLVQEEPEPPQIKEEQEDVHQRPEVNTLLAVKSEDDDENISREAEPLASTSFDYMKRQADLGNSGEFQPSTDVNVLSSHCSESDTEDSDEWEENREDQSDLDTLNPHKTHVEEERLHLSHGPSNKWTKQTTSIRTQNGEDPCRCKVCGKDFNCTSRLNSHMMFHAAEKPYSCTVCSNGFVQKNDLKKHMMIHTGDRPYICKVCGKAFVRNAHLKVHMMSHEGETPYSCRVCSKGFVQQNDLNRHILIHTGEKPYSCNICGKAFNLNGNLKRHKVIHT